MKCMFSILLISVTLVIACQIPEDMPNIEQLCIQEVSPISKIKRSVSRGIMTPEVGDTADLLAPLPRTKTCNYYHCILKKLSLVDASGLPSVPLIEEYISSRITTGEDIQNCFILQQSFQIPSFSGKKNSDSFLTEINEETIEVFVGDGIQYGSPTVNPNACEAAMYVVDCLSQMECKIFNFP